MSDDARKAILSRRARFVAAALTAVGTSAMDGCKPQPCLEPTPVDAEMRAAPADAGTAPVDKKSDAAEETMAPPEPCLKIAMPQDAGPPPMPCLSVALPPDGGPVPMPCLSPMPPKKDPTTGH